MLKFGTREEYHEKIGFGRYGEDNCPFCNLDNDEYIIGKGKFWYIIHNKYPYTGNDMHIMAVPYRHIIHKTELNNDELLDLKFVYKFVEDFFKDKGDYFSCTRETFAHRSIEHLHIHFIAGKLQGKYLRKMLEKQGFPIKEKLDL